MRYSQTGKAIHSFSLECADKNKDGSWDNLYIKVTTFDKTAEFVNQYFHEGSVAIVTGKLVTKIWEKTDGTKQYDITLKFPNVEFAPKDKSIEGANQQGHPNYGAGHHSSGQAPQQHTDYQQPQQGYEAPQQMPEQQLPIPDIDEDEIPF